jgi:hypothetical protein
MRKNSQNPIRVKSIKKTMMQSRGIVAFEIEKLKFKLQKKCPKIVTIKLPKYHYRVKKNQYKSVYTCCKRDEKMPHINSFEIPLLFYNLHSIPTFAPS